MQPKEGKNGGSKNGSQAADPAAIREELERVLASSAFRSSKRHSCFLRHVVEETLNGNAAQLKERSIGVHVFGLDPAYDTSANPVVRVSAGELRRRLRQFYYEAPVGEGGIRIDLAPGSYVPQFGAAPPDGAEPGEPPLRRSRHYGLYSATGVLVLAGLTLWMKPWTEQDAFAAFWRPVWESPGQTLIAVAGRRSTDENGRVPGDRLALGDAIALARLAPVLASHGKDFRILTLGATTLADLKSGPAILIGAFSNDFAMRLMREARFNFEFDPGTRQPWIKDRQNPTNQQWRLDRPLSELTGDFTDYVIVSRVVDPATGRLAVVAAGVTERGTQAAGEFLGSRAAMSVIPPRIAKAWSGRNLQIVLAVPLTPQAVGLAHVLTTYSW